MLKLQMTVPFPMELCGNRKLQTSSSEYLTLPSNPRITYCFYLEKLLKKKKTLYETGKILTHCQKVYKLVQPPETLFSVSTTGPTSLS